MLDPIGTYSPEAVIEAIEADLAGASLVSGRTPDGVVYRGADVTWVYTGGQAPSRVLRARFDPAVAEDRVAQVGDCFRSWDAPVHWWVGPTSWPPELSALLQADGFDAGQVWTGTARGLDDDCDGMGGGVDRVQTPSQAAAWTAMSVADGEPAMTITADRVVHDARCRLYLTTSPDGQPIGRGMAYLCGGVVGLHWLMATDAAIAERIGRRAIADAREAGARLAVFTAAGAAVPVAAALGFRPYCQWTAHAWPPADPVAV